MQDNKLDLRPFRRRVRVLRAWRGLALGLLLGGVGGLVWAVLDVTGVWFTEWSWLGLVFAGPAVLCALVALLLPVGDDAVARSIDRRAGLRDRLGTMIERNEAHDSFDEALRHDATRHVSELRARSVFPVRVGRWQYIAACAVALASLVFLLGNTWYVLSPEASKAKAEMEKIAAQIERVAKPVLDRKDATEEERDFANQLDAFAKRLEKGRMTKEEAMQRANELAKQAQKLSEKRTERAFEKMQTAREQLTMAKLGEKGLKKDQLDKLNLDSSQKQLLDQLQRELGPNQRQSDDKFNSETMQELGLQDMDPSLLNLTDEQRDMLREMIQKKLNDIDKKLANSQNLTEDELQQLLDQKQALQEMQDQLDISEEARKALEEFMNSPEYKDIMKAVQKMRDAAQQVNDGKPLTEEQIKELEQMIEELAELLKDSKYRDMVIEQLKAALEMLKQGKALGLCQGACLSPFGLNLGINPIRGFGQGGRSKDDFFAGYGGINKSDQEEKGEGQTNLLGVRGQRRNEGEEWFVEVKAPSAMGDRTSVPYGKVLPQYKDAAEKSIERQEIPKEHEKRVREYFESLGGGKN